MGNSVVVTRTRSSKEHLCNTCFHDFANCKAEEEFLEFGDGRGNDNVIACATYMTANCDEANQP